MKTSAKTIEQKLQRDLLKHVVRYRMTTFDAAERAMTTPGTGALKHTLRQLCRTGHLCAAPLYHNRRYYFLTDAGHSALSKTRAQQNGQGRHGPLSEIAKIRNYAMLAFCCLSSASRERLTIDEIRQHFPQVHRFGSPQWYYVDLSNDVRKLGFLRVDTAGHGRWDRIVAKCREDLKSHWLQAEAKTLIQQESFELTLLTAFPQKAERVIQAAADWDEPWSHVLKVCAVPELLNLIAPPPTS